MAQKSKTARRSPKEIKKKKIQPEDRALHIMMPFILTLFALFFTLCFIFGKKLGVLGDWAAICLKGLFSGGAYALPPLLLLHAVFYKRDLAAGSNVYKFWFTFGNMTFIGALCGFFSKTEMTWSATANWKGGLDFTTGGLVGGTVGRFLYMILGYFMPVIGILGVLVLSLLMFGKTPADLIRAIFIPLGEKMQEGREERQERRELDRERREEEKLLLAQKRAEEEKLRFQEEKKKGKKGKCAAIVDSGEEVTETPPEDLVPDDEVRIRLPLEEAAALAPKPEKEVREITPIEEMESEPVPDLHAQVQEIFSRPPSTGKSLFQDDPVRFDEPADPDAPVRFDEPLSFPLEEEELAEAERELKASLGEPLPEPEAEKESLALSEEDVNDDIEEEYHFPPISLLGAAPPPNPGSRSEQENTARKLVETLESFGVKTTVSGISKGPAVTRYELQPQRGVRVRSIVNLTDDIALATASSGVRIEAPIPGKEAVGIEVPNKARDTVFVRELIESENFENSSPLYCTLGKDVAGNYIYSDLSKMPHILIAGATGMGKSVCLNSLIVSMLYRASPEEVQMILIDPKKVEFNKYNGIPHLLVPVVSDSKKAAGALNWAVIEMEKRFIELEEVGARDIKGYNAAVKNDPDRKQMSYIVIVIDELADLMMTAKNEVETSICRLAQKARAAGMHLVIGTQRPSVDVITGLIKANVPSRIACTVASQVDSRTIIDIIGAEKLLGKGDMLYAPVVSSKPLRVQGCFVSDSEVESICDFIRSQRGAAYDESVSNLIEREAQKCGMGKKGAAMVEDGGDGDEDPMLKSAIELAIDSGKISTSLIQRRMSLGYGRAAKLIDRMEQLGYVSAPDGSKPRDVLISKHEYMEMRLKDEAPFDV